jgi:hypothetical protein
MAKVAVVYGISAHDHLALRSGLIFLGNYRTLVAVGFFCGVRETYQLTVNIIHHFY